jgi:uncharacterized protein YndB with AHSA1/START domain
MKANDQYGKFTASAEVRIVRTLPGPIERVWDYLTDSEKRSRWFAGGHLEQRKGGKVTLMFRHKNLSPNETPPEDHKEHHDPGVTMVGTVTRCEPPRVLAFSFGSSGESEATFELTPQGENVLLVVTHRARGEDVPYMAEFAAGWHTHFAYLIALLEGTPLPAFWALHARLRVEYEKLRIAAQQS